MRPLAVHNEAKRLIYYPIRKAASSSIQHAIGYNFDHWQQAQAREGTHFTCWRPPHERLASLYIGSIAPALSGFYHPWKRHGLEVGMAFDDYIRSVCAIPNDAHCDEHFVVANWPDLVQPLRVFHFRHLPQMADELNLKLERIGRSHAAWHPKYNDELLTLVRNRFAREYELYEE